MVEVKANSLDDVLVSGLQYNLGGAASYVDRRESCSFFPLGSNIYSAANGNKVLRIAINSDGFLDPSTVRFNFTLVNNTGAVNFTSGPNSGKQDYSKKRLRPLSGPWSWWRRMRVLCNQTVAEDYTDYNKVHELYEQLQNENVRINDDVMGYDGRWDVVEGIAAADSTGIPLASLPGVSAGSSRPCSFTPLSGILGKSQTKYIPLKLCPIIFEMEIVSNQEDCVVKPVATGLAGDSYHFTADNTTTDWQIQDCQIKADIVYLHPEIANAYYEHSKNGSLPIKYTTYNTLNQSITGAGTQLSINVARSCTRLVNVFASFYNNTSPRYWLKPFNSFLHPMINSPVVDGTGLFPAYDSNYELEWQIQIGSRFYPAYPVRSTAESFSHLLKTLNYPNKYQHSSSIKPVSFRSTKFMIAYDFEKMRDASFSGINTSSGDLMIIRVRASPIVSTSTTSNVNVSGFGDNMFIILVSDNILNISDVGTEVQG